MHCKLILPAKKEIIKESISSNSVIIEIQNQKKSKGWVSDREQFLLL